MTLLTNKIVLLVDDEPEIQEILADEFEFAGATVFLADGGAEAFELLSRKRVDLVVSDIRMAAGDGIELLKKLKTTHVSIPIVFLMSGHSDFTRTDAYHEGAEAFFGKPFKIDMIVNTAIRALTPANLRWTKDTELSVTEIKLPIELTDLESLIKSKSVSIGRGGIFIACETNFPQEGATVAFPWGKCICRWQRASQQTGLKKGYGLEFDSVENQAIEFLEKIIKKYSGKPYIPKE